MVIQVYTTEDARAAGIAIQGDDQPPGNTPAVAAVPEEPPRQCVACARVFEGDWFGINGMCRDKGGRWWDSPYWTCKHNVPGERRFFVCADCRPQACPVCGCTEEYT